jgi:hypothetical protein
VSRNIGPSCDWVEGSALPPNKMTMKWIYPGRVGTGLREGRDEKGVGGGWQ